MPNSITYVTHTSNLNDLWLQEKIPKYFVWLKKIRSHAQNMMTILSLSQHNRGGGKGELYDPLMSMKIFTLVMNKILI